MIKSVRLPHNTFVVSRIIHLVARSYNLTVAELGSPRRPRRIVWARQVAIYGIRHATTYNLNQVAALFACNASNVVWAERAVANQIATSASAALEVNNLFTLVALRAS